MINVKMDYNIFMDIIQRKKQKQIFGSNKNLLTILFHHVHRAKLKKASMSMVKMIRGVNI